MNENLDKNMESDNREQVSSKKLNFSHADPNSWDIIQKLGILGMWQLLERIIKKGLELTFFVQGVVNAKERREVLSCIHFHCLSNTLYVCKAP